MNNPKAIERTKDRIKVMQHFADGGVVEYRKYTSDNSGTWSRGRGFDWDWLNYQYRIAQSPIANGHNTHQLTEDQVEVDKGWRLLESLQIKSDTNRSALSIDVFQAWNNVSKCWSDHCPPLGSAAGGTYRTRLSVEEMAKYDKPVKTKVPLTSADFTPGTVIRHKAWGKHTWTMVTFAGASRIRYTLSEGAREELAYKILMESEYSYSTDGGKTWNPCYKEI